MSKKAGKAPKSNPKNGPKIDHNIAPKINRKITKKIDTKNSPKKVKSPFALQEVVSLKIQHLDMYLIFNGLISCFKRLSNSYELVIL